MENKNSLNNRNNEQHGGGFLVMLLVVVILIGVIIFVAYVSSNTQSSSSSGSSSSSSSSSSGGSSSLFSRSANNGDIVVDSDLDLSALGVKYVITPQVDISNLVVTLKFLDENKDVLSSMVKSLGNVKEGVQVSFSVSLLELSWSTVKNIEYESCSVTGGTVSYFA